MPSQEISNERGPVILSYSLQGPSILECSASGSWDRAPPTCHLVLCGKPPAIKDAVITGSNFTLGSTVTYTCKEGWVTWCRKEPLRAGMLQILETSSIERSIAFAVSQSQGELYALIPWQQKGTMFSWGNHVCFGLEWFIKLGLE